ncbi:hypothetical protein GQ53DRAFT_91749 [Thozetella sp. PMI_491]|nr:hypothetical protein GQ53DRAFT_91749 [Thozetella sp. PMI_491]
MASVSPLALGLGCAVPRRSFRGIRPGVGRGGTQKGEARCGSQASKARLPRHLRPLKQSHYRPDGLDAHGFGLVACSLRSHCSPNTTPRIVALWEAPPCLLDPDHTPCTCPGCVWSCWLDAGRSRRLDFSDASARQPRKKTTTFELPLPLNWEKHLGASAVLGTFPPCKTTHERPLWANEMFWQAYSVLSYPPHPAALETRSGLETIESHAVLR